MTIFQESYHSHADLSVAHVNFDEWSERLHTFCSSVKIIEQEGISVDCQHPICQQMSRATKRTSLTMSQGGGVGIGSAAPQVNKFKHVWGMEDWGLDDSPCHVCTWDQGVS